MNKLMSHFAGTYRTACTRVALLCQVHATALMLVLGVVLLTGGIVNLTVAQGTGPSGSFSEAQFDDTLVRHSVGNLFKLIEGAFGALIMVVSGLGAIVAAAMGAYRAAVGMLVVAVGAFVLRSLVSLFFGGEFDDFDANAG